MIAGTDADFLYECVSDPAGHRRYVGPPEKFDVISASQFSLLVGLGLREDHRLLDIGCGSLRGGRLFITYLRSGNYFAIEPQRWLVEKGIECELGRDVIELKRPTFLHDGGLTLTAFGQQFDFLLAQSIFSHASPAQLRRCLAQAKLALAPRGIFAATYIPGAEDYRGESWVYPGPVTYTFDRLHALAAELDLACAWLEWDHPNGQEWVAFYHPEREPPCATLTPQSVLVRQELAQCRRRIAQLESHPYVRAGRAVTDWFGRLVGKRRSQLARPSAA